MEIIKTMLIISILVICMKKCFYFHFFGSRCAKLNCHFLARKRRKIVYLLASEVNEKCRKSRGQCPRLYLGHQFTCDFKNSSFFLSQLVIYYFFFNFFPKFLQMYQGFSRYFDFQSMKNRFFST